MGEMKASGIDWIKDMPQSWELKKVKFLATERDSLFIDGDWIESDVIEESGIRYLTTGNVGIGVYKEQGFGYVSEETFKVLHCLEVFPGDLMISRLNEPIGRACIVPAVEKQYVVAVDIVIIRPDKKHSPKYLMYLMNTDGYAEHGNMIARGATMSRISRSQLGQFWIPIPAKTEQVAIAAFLDDRCGQVNGIIADLERQVELLRQYKKALITETVTKGLNKSVPMKNSGIDWIGETPSHWEIKKIKYCANKIGSGKTPLGGAEIYEEEGVTFIRSQNVYDDGLRLDDVVYIHPSIDNSMASTRVLFNDVLFNITGASIGRCCVYNRTDRANVNQHVCIIRTNTNLLLPEFLRYVLNSAIGQTQVILCQMGGNRESVTFEQLGMFNIVVPPLSEQRKMISRLNGVCSEADALITEKQRSIEIMRQYKRSLIYEYVTGKKRVAH